MRPSGEIRFVCVPAAMQISISSAGEPSLVTAPLKILTATSSFSFRLQVALEIMPLAPSPSSSLTSRSSQEIFSSPSSLGVFVPDPRGVEHGFPEKDKNPNSGISNSHAGSSGKRLQLNLNKPSFLQALISSGKDVSWLPASIHFCNRSQRPILFGNSVIALSVRINHLSRAGKLSSGMKRMVLLLKATISRFGHAASSAGKVVKEQFEKKAILRFVSWLIEDGSWERLVLPERSRISRVEEREMISIGNCEMPEEILSLVMPLYRPDWRPSRL